MLERKNRNQFEEFQNYLGRILSARNIMEREDSESEPKAPDLAKTVTFQVTDDCNLRCTYCYQINKGKRKMTFEMAKDFINMLIKESYEEGSFVDVNTSPGIIFEFIGGEPLLEIDLIDEICEYIKWKTTC